MSRRKDHYLTLIVVASLGFGACVQPPEPESNTGGNRSPVISSLVAEPSTVAVGSSSAVTVIASDPDNNPLTYRWMASTGDIIGEGSSVRFTASFCCTGPNFVEVIVKDNAGGSTSQRVDVLINY